MAGRATLPDGYRRQAHDSLPSTNAAALAAARNGEAGGLWITAAEQTAGRGRRGRAWVSRRGNLHASLLLVDPAPADMVATIAFAAGLALHQAIVDVAGPAAAARLRLKWPNDLICAGRKVAGILVEGENFPDGRIAAVIGIGVNCLGHPPVEGSYPAGDLGALGVEVGAEPLFARLAIRAAEEIARWARGGGFPDIRERWLDRALGSGEAIRVNLPDRVLEGRFEMLDAAGRLVVARHDGAVETVTAGDVFFGGGDPRT